METERIVGARAQADALGLKVPDPDLEWNDDKVYAYRLIGYEDRAIAWTLAPPPASWSEPAPSSTITRPQVACGANTESSPSPSPATNRAHGGAAP